MVELLATSENDRRLASLVHPPGYINPDPVAEKRVRDALNNFGAAVLIPRAPLTPGTYDVAMTVGGRRYAWSFTISP